MKLCMNFRQGDETPFKNLPEVAVFVKPQCPHLICSCRETAIWNWTVLKLGNNNSNNHNNNSSSFSIIREYYAIQYWNSNFFVEHSASWIHISTLSLVMHKALFWHSIFALSVSNKNCQQDNSKIYGVCPIFENMVNISTLIETMIFNIQHRHAASRARNGRHPLNHLFHCTYVCVLCITVLQPQAMCIVDWSQLILCLKKRIPIFFNFVL